MPGLFGFLRASNATPADDERTCRSLASSAVPPDSGGHDRFFSDDKVCFVHSPGPGLHNRDAAIYETGDILVSVDGEFYQPAVTSPAAYLAERYAAGDGTFDFLSSVDGVFSAMLYDRRRQLIHLVSDRWGLAFLYFSRSGERFSWSATLRGFLHLPWLSLRPSKDGVSVFLQNGYFPGESTWYDEISLVPWASVVTCDIPSRRVTSHRYWDYRQIRHPRQRATFEEYREQLSCRFIRAVERRCGAGERIVVGLSGGLDSRAILAAAAPLVPGLQAYTFGAEGCGDIEVARKAAGVAGIPHLVVLIGEENWIQPRVAGVWASDGMLDLMHMHGIEALPQAAVMGTIELNGFLGDALAGGSYGTGEGALFERFFNRGRRFIRAALLLCRPWLNVRMPFIDNDLVEFVVGTPAALHRNSRLYNAMLRGRYPSYFETIPWVKAGVPISYPRGIVLGGILAGKIARRLGLPARGVMKPYADYAAWLRRGPARQCVERVLLDPAALCTAYIDKEKIQREVREHFAGNDRSRELCRWLTLELWLQQSVKGRWRDYKELRG